MTDVKEYEQEYGHLKNNLLLLSAEGTLKTLMVVSAVSGEGSSTIASNLAVSLAHSSSLTVLMIDGNFRRPTVSEAFQLEKEKGLADLILGRMCIEDVLKKTKLPNLFVITSGEYEGNPADLFVAPRFKTFIDEVRGKFDYIIFDAAPLATYADSALLARCVDGVILVVQAGKTRWEVAQRARAQLEIAKAKILGVVLNRRKYVIPDFLYRHL
jgi:capsular exopolysaccharide synthesis family protein